MVLIWMLVPRNLRTHWSRWLLRLTIISGCSLLSIVAELSRFVTQFYGSDLVAVGLLVARTGNTGVGDASAAAVGIIEAVSVGSFGVVAVSEISVAVGCAVSVRVGSTVVASSSSASAKSDAGLAMRIVGLGGASVVVRAAVGVGVGVDVDLSLAVSVAVGIHFVPSFFLPCTLSPPRVQSCGGAGACCSCHRKWQRGP